jgi:3-deoxy-D-manno-octulosonic-acid transferase
MSFGMKVGSFFNAKLKKGILGRENSLQIVKENILPKDKVIWMHAASLGEYEQGLPVLEKLKEKFPLHKIVISFFSPSGYEIVFRKKHSADVFCYLPFDKKSSISEFVKTVHPEIFFTVKYDYWYNLLAELKKINCKTFVVSALFYNQQVFFKSYGKWFVHQLQKNIDCFFHQNENSLFLAKKIGLTKGLVSGDTRFDRVKKIKERDIFVNFISEFKQNEKLIVLGSSWEAEERIAKQIHKRNSSVKIIIAPHEMKRVEALINLFPDAVLYSSLHNQPISSQKFQQKNILIVDSVGLLSKIYSYADIAVVGGGFHGKGLHNILEAATFGIPVFFGNRYKKNPEADNLINFGGAKSFENEDQLSDFVLSILQNNEKVRNIGNNSQEFIAQQPNSTQIIIEKILQLVE